jgi:alpha-glucosidase
MKLAITMLLTLRGTPFLYYGEEIGMENTSVPKGQAMDPLERFPLIPGRAQARTPMQWSSKSNAGFTSGTPWLPINKKFVRVNVEDEAKDSSSTLNYYKELISLRQSNDVLKKGELRFLLNEHPHLIAFERSFEGKKAVVILNFSHREQFIPEEVIAGSETCAFGTHGKQKGVLKALEGRIYISLS